MGFSDKNFNELLEYGYSEILDTYPFYAVGWKYIPKFGKNIEKRVNHLVQLNPDKVKADNETLFFYYLNTLYFGYLYGVNHLNYIGADSNNYKPIAGHFYDMFGEDYHLNTPSYGPLRKADVYILAKSPSYNEELSRRNFTGDFGELLFDTLQELEIDPEAFNNFYLANLSRIYSKSTAVHKEAVRDFSPLVEEEIRILQPEIILCIGTDALKYFARVSITNANREPIDYKYNYFDKYTSEEKVIESTVTAIPLTALHEYSDYLIFRKSLKNFVNYVYFEEPRPDNTFDYTVISNESDLKELINTILSKPELVRVSIDLEWHGRIPTDSDAFIRIVSLAYTSDHAYLIELYDEESNYIFDGNIENVGEELNRLFDPDNNVQIIGHNFISDTIWMESIGVDVVRKFIFPEKEEDIYNPDYPGIFDTIIAHHAYDETATFDLETSCEYLLDVQAWSTELEKFISEYCKKNKIKRKQLHGFGPIPKEILYPYGAQDAIHTFNLAKIHREGLNKDRFGNNCWKAYWINMRALPGFLEMHRTGILVDKDRLEDISKIFINKLEELEKSFRLQIGDENFNFRSYKQVIPLLFGKDYVADRNYNADTEDNKICFNLSPIKTAGQNSLPWEDRYRGVINPATDLETCEYLIPNEPRVSTLRQLKILDQAIKNDLKPPDEGFEYEGEKIYSGGLASFVCENGRIHPQYAPLNETGRCRCSNPNLQNLAKTRESDYSEILGDDYVYTIRSIFKSDIDLGYALLEVDFSGAELLVLGVSADDKLLIEDYYRSNLPEDHPDHMDIHSKVATLAFKLDCPPSKKGLEEAGKKDLRICAKRIIFGLNYGRSANSCYLQLKASGMDISLEDTQKVIDTIYNRYSNVHAFQENVKKRVESPGWLCNCFGRYRRFWRSRSRELIAKMQREALNFPCQSGVADAVSQVMYHLYYHPRKDEIGYKLILHNHDAISLLVPIKHLDEVENDIVKECFVDKVKLRPCNLDGIIYPNSPVYNFNVDSSVCIRWDEPISREELYNVATTT